MVQGLINYYQPDGPIEHFLIQQIAMGMVRQYRLWTVEAAIANIEILKSQQQQHFPDRVIRDFLESSDHRSPDQGMPNCSANMSRLSLGKCEPN